MVWPISWETQRRTGHITVGSLAIIVSQDGIEVVQMRWWEALLFFAVVILAIWGFVSIVGVETRFFTRRTDRTAEDMYDEFADPPRKQHQYARDHGGERRNE